MKSVARRNTQNDIDVGTEVNNMYLLKNCPKNSLLRLSNNIKIHYNFQELKTTSRLYLSSIINANTRSLSV